MFRNLRPNGKLSSNHSSETTASGAPHFGEVALITNHAFESLESEPFPPFGPTCATQVHELFTASVP
jgi:hypothetical protein